MPHNRTATISPQEYAASMAYSVPARLRLDVTPRIARAQYRTPDGNLTYTKPQGEDWCGELEVLICDPPDENGIGFCHCESVLLGTPSSAGGRAARAHRRTAHFGVGNTAYAEGEYRRYRTGLEDQGNPRSPGLTPDKVAMMVQEWGTPVKKFRGVARLWAEAAARPTWRSAEGHTLIEDAYWHPWRYPPGWTGTGAPRRRRRRRRRLRRTQRRGILAGLLGAIFRRRPKRKLAARRGRPTAGPTIECNEGDEVAIDAFGNLYCRKPKELSL